MKLERTREAINGEFLMDVNLVFTLDIYCLLCSFVLTSQLLTFTYIID